MSTDTGDRAIANLLASRDRISNGLAEEALEYSIAAEDIDTATRLVGQLCIPTYYQGRRNSPQRWLRWLEEQDGRLMPLLSTHPSVPEIAAELFVSRNTVKSQVLSIYRKLDASSRIMAVGQARELGLLEGKGVFQVFGVKKSDRPRGGMVSDAGRRRMSQMARFRETLRRLAVFHESFVADEVGLRLELAETSALDPERGNAALL
jgi:Bacterial regulatory proteins, luxR family